MSQLQGKIAEVATTIPAVGLGEVYVSVVSGTVYHMAASMEKQMIKEGTRVVVVEVRDHVLYVTPFPEYLEEETSER
jgi:membrane protein implicated in regulation of membrane protease activity